MLDKPQRETFKNQWVRLISNTQTAYRNFFTDSEPEVINQKYNNQRV
jgi:hypothetical protein